MFSKIFLVFIISTIGSGYGSLLGAPTVANPEGLDPEVVKFATSQIAGFAEGSKHVEFKVSNLKEQVVSGMIYTFTLSSVETNCTKTEKAEGNVCTEDQESRIDCDLKVWSQPWMKKMVLQDSKCNRQIDGVEVTTEPQVVEKVVPLLGEDDHDLMNPSLVTERTAIVEEKVQKAGIKMNKDNYKTAMKKLLKEPESRAQLLQLQSHSNFKKFVLKFERKYEHEEEYRARFRVFRQNMKKVQFLRETELGTGEYGVTEFSDWTEEEFKASKTGLKPERNLLSDDWPYPSVIPDVPVPTAFDWRDKNVVTDVKNQGMCGSCWAFSVTGNVEGQWALKTGSLISLSEQELVDCDRLDNGCNGGLPSNAYHALMKLGGLEAEDEYTYDGKDEQCKFDKKEVDAVIKGGYTLPTNETQLAQWLIVKGPISIGLNANAMQFYMGGVSHPWKFLCSASGIDHGVLIVGLGIHEYPLFKTKMPYWIIKNSWGPNWGEQGYYRLYRGDGTCGVNQMATTSIV